MALERKQANLVYSDRFVVQENCGFSPRFKDLCIWSLFWELLVVAVMANFPSKEGTGVSEMSLLLIC